MPLGLLYGSRAFCLVFANYAGVIYTVGTISLLFYVNAYFTCPVLEDDCTPYVAFGMFALFEIVLNLFCFHYFAYLNRVDSVFPAEATPAATLRQDGSYEFHGNPETTKFCFNCQRTAPIRSHHCPLCQYCVLKKDHHCFLTGGCVGFGNQRYFVVFLFWAAIGALYGTWFTGRYLNTFFKPFLPFGFVDYFFPFALKKWVFTQHCTIGDLGFIMVFSAGFGGGIGALVFFLMQLRLILKGQTMYEMMKRERLPTIDRLPFGLRMQCVFGKYWYLNFLFPTSFPNRMDESFKRLLYECHLKEL